MQAFQRLGAIGRANAAPPPHLEILGVELPGIGPNPTFGSSVPRFPRNSMISFPGVLLAAGLIAAYPSVTPCVQNRPPCPHSAVSSVFAQ